MAAESPFLGKVQLPFHTNKKGGKLSTEHPFFWGRKANFASVGFPVGMAAGLYWITRIGHSGQICMQWIHRGMGCVAIGKISPSGEKMPVVNAGAKPRLKRKPRPQLVH
jgi:hypothetical protein